MVEIEKKWFGDKTKCADSTNLLSSNSLGLESFWGLFLIVGIAAISVFIVYVIRFLHEHWHVVVDYNPESTILSKIIELLQRFDNRDLNAHTFRNIGLKERNCGDCEAEEKAMKSHENLQESPSSSSPTNSPASAIFSDYTEQNINFRREQGSSEESPMTNSQGEASQMTEQETEPANTNRNEGRY